MGGKVPIGGARHGRRRQHPGRRADHSSWHMQRRRCAQLPLYLDATRDFTAMLTTSDPAPLRRYLDADAIWVSATGTVRSRAELIEFVRRDPPRVSARLESASVRVFGNVAIVTWSESWTAPGAAVAPGWLAGVDTWIEHKGTGGSLQPLKVMCRQAYTDPTGRSRFTA